MEERSNTIPKLTAFIKTEDDALFPTKLRDIKQKLNPQGKALLSFTAKIPMEMDTKGLKLIIGESVTEERLSQGDDKADAYINAVQMELANENNAVSRTLKDVDFYPYSISLSRIQAWLDSKQLRIQFTYKLGKDSYYETKTEGNKVVIQFTDSNGNVNFDETFYLETAPEKEDLKMEIGEHDYKMVRQDTDLVTKIQSLTTYKMSVYYEISGKRKLLAEQTMDWFGITE